MVTGALLRPLVQAAGLPFLLLRMDPLQHPATLCWFYTLV